MQTKLKTQEQEYKETELGQLPKEWDVVKLGDVVSKKIKDGVHKTPHYIENGVPFITAKDIIDNKVCFQECRYISKEEHNNLIKTIKPEKGDILLTKVGTVGNVAIVDFDKEFSIFVQIALLKPKKSIDSLFLKYSLLSPSVQKDIDDKSAQSTMKFIGVQRIAGVLTYLPPLPEQQKIAFVLSTIQEAGEKTENAINSLKELKKSLMKHLFTYGAVGFEDSENVELKDTEIGKVPKSWDVVKFGAIAEFKNGINFNAKQKGSKGILTIDVLNMYGKNIFVDLNKLYRVNKEIDESYLLNEGDVLFVRSSLKREGVGWASLFKKNKENVTFCGFIIRARINKIINSGFLVDYLRTDSARERLISYSGKVAITNINQGMLGRLEIPLPSLQEQQQIASILSAVDEKIQAEENKKKALDELFKSMLHNLMTAKIRVNELEI